MADCKHSSHYSVSLYQPQFKYSRSCCPVCTNKWNNSSYGCKCWRKKNKDMQSDPMAVLGLILISFEVFNLTTFLHNLNLSLSRKLFCASVSRKLEKEQKRGMKGKGEGKKKTPLTANPMILKKILMCNFWLVQNGHVNWKAISISIKLATVRALLIFTLRYGVLFLFTYCRFKHSIFN